MIYMIHMIFTVYNTFELKSQSLYLLKILTLTHFPPRLPECCHYWHRQVYYQQSTIITCISGTSSDGKYLIRFSRLLLPPTYKGDVCLWWFLFRVLNFKPITSILKV